MSVACSLSLVILGRLFLRHMGWDNGLMGGRELASDLRQNSEVYQISKKFEWLSCPLIGQKSATFVLIVNKSIDYNLNKLRLKLCQVNIKVKFLFFLFSRKYI